METARRNMIEIPMAGQTVVHQAIGEHGASRVLIKPAAPGTGVIAGGAVRQILEAGGIKDALAKSLGSPTHLNVAKAAMNALIAQRRPDDVAKLRGKKAEDIVPPGLLAAYRGTESLRAHSK
jgi:small subunit ribosomal protein S5